MIFFRKGVRGQTKKGVDIMYDLEEKINFAVFPGAQGGPHNHTISALATALHQCGTEEYKDYQKQVLTNNFRFADVLMKLGYSLVSGGTDNHLVRGRVCLCVYMCMYVHHMVRSSIPPHPFHLSYNPY